MYCFLFLEVAASAAADFTFEHTVDTETDRAIQKALREAFQSCTVLVIAHRLQTILDSDWLLYMDNGRIKDQGPPSDIIKRQASFFGNPAPTE